MIHIGGYKRILACDIETYSSVSLQKCGVYAYAASPDFEILLFGYAWDDEPAQVIDLTREGLPEELQEALYDPDVIKTAYNAQFERTCISAYLGQTTPPEQWRCTAVLSRELGLPASLEAVGEVIGLPEEKQKLKTGKALIRYFSIPCKPTKTNGQRTRNLPEHDPEKWALYIDYNRQDVETEREIRKRLSRFSVIETEQPLWEADQHINDRGVGIDVTFAKRAIEMDEIIKARLYADAQELTGLDNPKSTAQLKGWIEETAGIEVASLNKKEVAGVREAANNDDVDKMLDIRAGLSKTSTEKYNAMLRTVGDDGRIRGLTMFYGAARTGRWAGRLVQMQNLPQNKMPEEDLDIARQLVRAGDLETLEACYDDVSGTLSQLIRTAFIPRPGCKFVVADFSAIEARVIAWLAGEQWRLDVFNTHGKIYEASAEQMFHLPPGSVKKGDPMRQKGKIAELALGYGGSVGALVSMGALAMGIPENELKPLVTSWRAANPAITRFWWDTDSAVRDTINTRTPSYLPHGIALRRQGSLLRLRLPNGRELSYVKPMVINDNITYEGTLQSSGHWGRIESYGPKFVENIVQATARDCLAETIMKAEALGYPVVFHVHDELICEVPEEKAEKALSDILEIMATPISWAEGLPLKGDGYICDYYKKE
ncbi:MAG: DNA polymerase [Clostridiales bacterium]|nr:DNA polymerase [Clostridiales bacterium]